ncbi:MEDS domain-containing protein [Actinophytocola sp.]|uniref:MEDS domain-containing protein n=1 Tax=Actinophytocola sp. TaxID=1872138 RepID=UPI00389B22D4
MSDLRRLGLHDHVCWGFDDDVAFRAAAVSFLHAGLALGQRVRYLGEREDDVAAQRFGATLVLRADQPVPRRLVRLPGWETVRVEVAA